MTDQINVKETAGTPIRETMAYRLAFISAARSRRERRRVTKAEVIRSLINLEYDAEYALRRAQPGDGEAEATK